MATWQMAAYAVCVMVYTTLMDPREHKPAHRAEAGTISLAAALCDIEKYFGKEGLSEFEYDDELDVFRFAEDGSFAFCREFADWDLLKKRGYLG